MKSDRRNVKKTASKKNNELRSLLSAATNMDWKQVVINGGPPCFHLENDRRFCGRAERWFGHGDNHKFVSLHDLLKGIGAPTSAKGEGA
jgi:hypothetical protein